MTTPTEPAAPAPGCAKGCLALVAGFALLVGGLTWWSVSASAPPEITTVTVSDTRQTDGDPEYEVVGDASVEWNEEDGEGGIVVNIRDTGTEDYRSPLLKGTVHYEDGVTVECSSRKSVIWGGSEQAYLRCPVLISRNIDHVDVSRI